MLRSGLTESLWSWLRVQRCWRKSSFLHWQSYSLKNRITITQEFLLNPWKALPNSCAWVSLSVQWRWVFSLIVCVLCSICNDLSTELCSQEVLIIQTQSPQWPSMGTPFPIAIKENLLSFHLLWGRWVASSKELVRIHAVSKNRLNINRALIEYNEMIRKRVKISGYFWVRRGLEQSKFYYLLNI